jgi:4-hydroxybenzoate polyprenyltransferase/geranylgeranylglycerol-phosphate geranylgeranyltransferase
MPTTHTLRTRLIAHLETWRPYSMFWPGMISLCGATAALHAFPPPLTATLTFLIPILGWIAGLYAMDYLDRNLDRIEKPQRPLPSGRLHPRHAIIAAFLFATLGVLLAIPLGPLNLLFILLIGTTTIFYTRIGKPHALLANLTRGLITMVTFLFGATAITTTLSTPLWLLATAFLFHDASSNIIGALRDQTGDRTCGLQTTPVRYGTTTALLLATTFYLTSIILITTTLLTQTIPITTTIFISLLIIATLLTLIMLTWAFTHRHTATRPQWLQAHATIVTERAILASAIILGISPTLPAATVATTVVTATILLQLLIRTHHEIPTTHPTPDRNT